MTKDLSTATARAKLEAARREIFRENLANMSTAQKVSIPFRGGRPLSPELRSAEEAVLMASQLSKSLRAAMKASSLSPEDCAVRVCYADVEFTNAGTVRILPGEEANALRDLKGFIMLGLIIAIHDHEADGQFLVFQKPFLQTARVKEWMGELVRSSATIN